MASLAGYLPMQARAGDEAKPYTPSEKNITQITQEYNDSHPVEIALESPQPKTSGISMSARTDEAGKLECSICYSASSWKEFLNGMAMPVTLWRENKSTGKTEILPAYSRPFRSGGFLSPEYGLIASGINGVGYLFRAKNSRSTILSRIMENSQAEYCLTKLY